MRLTTIIWLLIISIGLSLTLFASRLNGQNNVPLPRNYNVQDHPQVQEKSEVTCVGFKDCTAWNSTVPTQIQVAFPGPNNMTLHGHLYVPGVNSQAELEALSAPSTTGPTNNGTGISQSGGLVLKKLYPVVIYNHGSEKNPGGVPTLAKLYVDLGYVFFAPDRHGQGLSKDAGPYILDLENSSGGGAASVSLHELYNLDVIAAIDWLKHQPFVNKQRLIMTGISYGGIQTLLTAEKDPGIRAYLPFTPAAMSWGNASLRQRLIKTVQNEKAPMLLIQAQGDYNLGPVTTLGPILAAKGDPTRWRARLYPRFGCTKDDAHGKFATNCGGISIWSPDVLKFIDKAFH